MFELRFEERISHNSREGTIKVLQFRTKSRHRDSSTTTPIESGWTEWVDVPVVKKGSCP